MEDTAEEITVQAQVHSQEGPIHSTPICPPGIRRLVGEPPTPRFNTSVIDWAMKKRETTDRLIWIPPVTHSDSGNYTGYPETLDTTVAPTLSTTMAPTELSTTIQEETRQPPNEEDELEEDQPWVTAATHNWTEELDETTAKKFHGPMVYRHMKPGLMTLPAPFNPRPHEDPDYENVLDDTGYLVPNPVVTPRQAMGYQDPGQALGYQDPRTEGLRQELDLNPIRGLIGQYMMNALGGRAETALRSLGQAQRPMQGSYLSSSSTSSTHAPSYGLSPVFAPTITYAPVSITLGSADAFPQLTDARGGGA